MALTKVFTTTYGLYWTLLNAYLVPMAGLEPARLAPLPPQDSVSTNFTTSAFLIRERCLSKHIKNIGYTSKIPVLPR